MKTKTSFIPQLLLLTMMVLLAASLLFAAEADPEFEFPTWLATVLSAVLVPWVTQQLKGISMRREVKFLIAVAVTIVTGALGALAVGAYTDFVTAVKTVFVASQAAYHLFWKPLFDYWELKKA